MMDSDRLAGCRFAAALAPAGPERRKLAVHVLGRAHKDTLEAAPGKGVQLVHDPDAFRRSLQLAPPVSGPE